MTTPDDRPDYLTEDDLRENGIDPAVLARLPVRHVAPDGSPFWPADELPDLLTLADREAHR